MDILLIINLFVNYFILLAVSKFLYLQQKKLRILAGAGLGAIYSLYIFIPEQTLIVSILIKALMAVTIVIVSFGINMPGFFKSLVCFCFISFLFSGLNFLMWITFKPRGMIVSNGIVYFNISPTVLIVSTVVTYFVTEMINKFLGRHICREEFYKVTIKVGRKTSCFNAFLDTGNSLKEPFSNFPVILVNKRDIRNIIPSNFETDDDISVSNLSQELGIKLRLIPFCGVSKTGFIMGFAPDNTVIESLSGDVFNKKAYIGICCDNNLEHALLGPDILDK